MQPDELKALSKHRLNNAKELLLTSKEIIKIGDYKSSANRSYYAIFNAMRAELALLGIDRKKHSAVISEFRLHFIKTGVFNAELSDIITSLFKVRAQSDYDDYYIITKSEVEEQLNNAEIFIKNVADHLSQTK